MDENEIQRLALMASALRPEWPARSLRTFIEKNLSNRAYGDAAVAFAWICTRTKTETPRLMLEAGAWWKAAGTESSSGTRPPTKAEACATCGKPEGQHNTWDEHEWVPVAQAKRGRVPMPAEMRGRASDHHEGDA